MSSIQLNIVVSVLFYFSNVVHCTSPHKLTGSPADIEIIKTCKINYALGANEIEYAKLLRYSQFNNGFSVLSNCIKSPGQLPVKDVGNIDMKIKVEFEMLNSGAKDLHVLKPKSVYEGCVSRATTKETSLWDYYCYKNTGNNSAVLLQCIDYCYVFNEDGFTVNRVSLVVRKGSSQFQNKYKVYLNSLDKTVVVEDVEVRVLKTENTRIKVFKSVSVSVEY